MPTLKKIVALLLAASLMPALSGCALAVGAAAGDIGIDDVPAQLGKIEVLAFGVHRFNNHAGLIPFHARGHGVVGRHALTADS